MAPNAQGIGRPFTGGARKSESIRIRLEPDELERLDRLANQLRMSRSGVIREGLRRLEKQIEPEAK